MDRDIVLEGLSQLVGVTVKAHTGGSNTMLRSAVSGGPSPNMLTVEKLLSAVYFPAEFWEENNYNKVGLRSMPSSHNDLFVMADDFFDPRFDYDFTYIRDTTTFMRGNEVYKRPCGWMRFALKVLNKYTDGNAWLGQPGYRTHSDPNEWPVSYHGTSLNAAQSIISNHYKPGGGQTYGRGVYSTPDVDIAEQHGYAKIFVSQKNGRTYKVCLQNRINPRVRQVFNGGLYWLIPVAAGTPPYLESQIVMGSIRPYSLLLKQV
ncbi:hypothetical protein ACEWY4_016988 [Coilia grayii]|uniref:PARP catalytic domain-containing protein n=1 Tax=Coilia grayii TaxID=363190 RepID=A0ABD1JLY2_9TELE